MTVTAVADNVVLLPGLWMPGGETLLLRRRLARAGFSTEPFSYRSVSENLDASAARLAQFLAESPRRHHLVGHSLGGVVMLAALQRHRPANVGRSVCLGSPLAGCSAARAFARWPAGSALLGGSHEALADSLPILPPEGFPVAVIAGDFAVGLGHLLADIQGASDGTVAVAETQVEGLADHIVLPVSHLAMLWSQTVAEQTIAFLRHGRFVQ